MRKSKPGEWQNIYSDIKHSLKHGPCITTKAPDKPPIKQTTPL